MQGIPHCVIAVHPHCGFLVRWQEDYVATLMDATALRIPQNNLYIMDPASSIVSIITFGFSVFRKVQSLREFIKVTPDQLQALQDSCAAAKLLLHRLEKVHERIPYALMDDMEIELLGQICSNVSRYLQDVNAALLKIAESTKDNGKGRFRRAVVCLWKWWLKADEVENVAKRLRVLQKSLLLMVNFTNSQFLERIMTRTEELRSCNCSKDVVNAAISFAPTPKDKALPCLPHCECACHTSIAPFTPIPPESHFGRPSQSRGSLLGRNIESCGLQTCWNGVQAPPEVRLPRLPGHSSSYLQSTLTLNRQSAPSPCGSPSPCRDKQTPVKAKGYPLYEFPAPPWRSTFLLDRRARTVYSQSNSQPPRQCGQVPQEIRCTPSPGCPPTNLSLQAFSLSFDFTIAILTNST